MADLKRAPFKEKFIKNLDFADFKVAVSGALVSKQENGFLLGDGTGEVYVNTTSLERPVVFNEKDIVKVFGRLTPYENGFELQAEIVQDLKKVDMEALTKIKEALL